MHAAERVQLALQDDVIVITQWAKSYSPQSSLNY